MTEYLTSEVLENFKHGFFKRTGGVSINEFSSLNCKYGSFDSISKINTNRALVSNLMGIKTSDLITLKQIHSSDVINIKERIEPDGARTHCTQCVYEEGCTPSSFSFCTRHRLARMKQKKNEFVFRLFVPGVAMMIPLLGQIQKIVFCSGLEEASSRGVIDTQEG